MTDFTSQYPDYVLTDPTNPANGMKLLDLPPAPDVVVDSDPESDAS